MYVNREYLSARAAAAMYIDHELGNDAFGDATGVCAETAAVSRAAGPRTRSTYVHACMQGARENILLRRRRSIDPVGPRAMHGCFFDHETAGHKCRRPSVFWLGLDWIHSIYIERLMF
jgi:hypothetical protein